MEFNKTNKAVADILNEENIFEMANLRPKRTGLPMVIWVKPKTNERHGPRIKVQIEHGNKARPKNMASVSIEKNPKLKEGNLSIKDFKLVSQFVKTYRVWLLQIWNDEIDHIDFSNALEMHQQGNFDPKYPFK